MLITILSFILVLSILVFVHESGHYLAARHVGVRVQKFSIGFPPKAFGKQIGDTEYILSWVPLGGYVKLEGQNLDDEDPSDPKNYASKTIMERFYILVAGPAMNLILAFAIMPLVFLIGVETPSYRFGPANIATTTPESPAQKRGILPGDIIVKIGGNPTPSWVDVYDELAAQAISTDVISIELMRGEHQVSVLIESNIFLSDKPIGWHPLIPPVIGHVGPDAPADKAGLMTGDRITSFNGLPLEGWDEIPLEIQKGNGAEIALGIDRGGMPLLLKVKPEFNQTAEKWMIGISPATRFVQHGPVESVVMGTKKLLEITKATFVFLGRMVSGKGSMDTLGGPVKIGIVIGEAARSGVANLVFLISIISLQLGIFNLLPIPALDGGHIFMLALEKLKGGPLSAKIRERAQMIGFSLLILLIIIVTYNDILQIIS